MVGVEDLRVTVVPWGTLQGTDAKKLLHAYRSLPEEYAVAVLVPQLEPNVGHIRMTMPDPAGLHFPEQVEVGPMR